MSLDNEMMWHCDCCGGWFDAEEDLPALRQQNAYICQNCWFEPKEDQDKE